MTDLLNKPVDPVKANAAADEFVLLAARGEIDDSLVENLGATLFEPNLMRLANEAEMTPWVFLDYVAERLGGRGGVEYNDNMLTCLSKSEKLSGLLMVLRYYQEDRRRRDAIATFMLDIEQMMLAREAAMA